LRNLLDPGDGQRAAAGELDAFEERRDRRVEPARARKPGGQPQQREVLRRIDVEAGPRGVGHVADGVAGRFQGPRRAVVGSQAGDRRQGRVEVTVDDERVGAEPVVGHHLAGDRGQEALERRVSDERQGAGPDPAQRVDPPLAGIGQGAASGRRVPGPPVERAGGRVRRDAPDGRAPGGEALAQLAGQQVAAGVEDGLVRAERRLLHRGLGDEDERRGPPAGFRHRRRGGGAAPGA
jgi:hypothetical protein